MSAQNKSFSYWRKSKVRAEVGLSYSTIWRLEKLKRFPQRYRLSANIIAYRSDEIQEWMRNREVVSGGAE